MTRITKRLGDHTCIPSHRGRKPSPDRITPTFPLPFKSPVLLIEDNTDHAELTVKALEHHLPQIEVEVAIAGEDGLNRVGQRGYDLAILDYQLPDADGLFWLEKIREQDPDLPVVLVTGRGSEGVAAEAFRKGAWDYIAKSIDYLDLLPRAVERSLERARLIREEKRQAAEIADLKQFNAEIVSALPLCLIVLDRELRVIFSNLRDCNLLGKACCERGCYFKELFHRHASEGGELARVLREARRVLQTQKPAELPGVRWISQGGERIVRVRITPMADGQEAALLLVLEDITSKKEMERQVIESKNKLEAIFGAIVDTIALLDRDFTIREITGSRVCNGGPSSGSLIGRQCYRELPKREEVCPGCPAQRVFETGLPASAVLPGLSHNGSPMELHISAYPLANERGEVAQVVAYIRDVTEEKQAMRQLEQSRRLSALGEMVAGIAHEVKNPLQNIRLGLDLLKGELGKESPLANLLQGIEQGMRTIDTIVEELLDYAWPMQLHRAPWDLRQVVEEALRGQEAALGAQGIRVERNWGKGPYEVPVDGMRMGQVLVNLFSNALDAMAQGGELQVSLGRQASQGKEWLSVEVADTGCGIPPQNLERVFDPFFTTKDSGVGLGMAIAHRLIELHHGRIEVRSQVGQGATFTVLLPLGDP